MHESPDIDPPFHPANPRYGGMSLADALRQAFDAAEREREEELREATPSYARQGVRNYMRRVVAFEDDRFIVYDMQVGLGMQRQLLRAAQANCSDGSEHTGLEAVIGAVDLLEDAIVAAGRLQCESVMKKISTLLLEIDFADPRPSEP